MSSLEREPSAQVQPRTSKRFHAEASDVTFRSSDGVLFRLHKINLAVNANAFPPQEFLTSDEIVEVSETSDVLEILFQFCYPYRRPDLELIEFKVLTSLAEAAEKYEVFSAMSMCNIRMRDNISLHPVDAMLYAARHGYTDILDVTYGMILKEPPGNIASELPPHLVVPWVLHYEKYNQVLQRAIAHYDTWKPQHAQFMFTKGPTGRVTKCASQTKDCVACHILRRLGQGVSALMDLDDVFGSRNDCCAQFTSGLALWRQAIEKDIQEVPPFHTTL